MRRWQFVSLVFVFLQLRILADSVVFQQATPPYGEQLTCTVFGNDKNWTAVKLEAGNIVFLKTADIRRIVKDVRVDTSPPLERKSDTIISKTGAKVTGRVLGADKDVTAIIRDTGDLVGISNKEIARVIYGFPRLLTLEESFQSVLTRLAQGIPWPGMLVLVDENQIMIDLGAMDGVHVGDEFEIVRKVTPITHPVSKEVIGEKRDVAGRLKVTSVQEKLAVCMLLEGKAEIKNEKGEYNKVVYAPTDKLVSLGAISLDPKVELTAETVKQAVISATGKIPRLKLTNEANVQYTMNIDVTPTIGGYRLVATFIERASDQQYARTIGAYRFLFTADEFGYGSALFVNTGIPLKLAPFIAAASRNGNLLNYDTYAVWPNFGTRGDTAYIFDTGQLVLASAFPIMKMDDLDRLEAEFDLLAAAVRETTVGLDDTKTYLLDTKKTRLFNSQAVVRKMVLPGKGFLKCAYTLELPNMRVLNAGTFWTGGGWRQATLRDVDIPEWLNRGGGRGEVTELLHFGEQAVVITPHTRGGSGERGDPAWLHLVVISTGFDDTHMTARCPDQNIVVSDDISGGVQQLLLPAFD